MRATIIKPSVIDPEISLEQFIPDHIFLYLTKGAVRCYDENESYILKRVNIASPEKTDWQDITRKKVMSLKI